MRTILHSDLNNFYASVECLRNPEIRDKPVVVVGSKEDRHGIVLAKNLIAKSAGVSTGDVWWEAKRKCGSELVEVKADFAAYLDVSRAVRRIYEDYTDKIEAFGIDECWLDVTELAAHKSGEETALEIRSRIKKELGLTVSIGVSWNKIFAKLGSDIKKPDAVTIISRDNFRQIVWPLPAEELLYVGRATKAKLNRMGIFTIGDLAEADKSALVSRLGKWGAWLHDFANGQDASRVVKTSEEQNVKSIGNSLTVWRDLNNLEEARMVIFMLADSVAARMRESGLFLARTVHVFARGSDLASYHKQGKLPRPTGAAREIAQTAVSLFETVYSGETPLRGLGVSVSDFYFGGIQTDMFSDCVKADKQKRLDEAVDKIRKKYGNKIIQLAVVHKDPRLKELDIKGEHVIHPYSFFRHN